MRKKKKRIIIGAITGLAVVLASTGIFLVNNKEAQKVINVNVLKREYSEKQDEESKYPYLSETTFDSTNEIDMRVFEFPFNKNAGEYTDNITLYSSYTDIFENFYDMAEETTSEYFLKILGTGYREISEDEEKYKEELMNLITTDSIHGVVSDNYVSDMSSWITDNEYQGIATYTSDSSLIWTMGGYGYMRGVLDVEVFSDTKGISMDCLPDGIEAKDGKKYIVDTVLVYDSSENKLRVSDVEIIADIS